MTKAEALSICRELTNLVAAGPARDPKKAEEAQALLDRLDTIPGMGQLAKLTLINITRRFALHFSSSKGIAEMRPETQRLHLTGDLALLCFEFESRLPDETNYEAQA